MDLAGLDGSLYGRLGAGRSSMFIQINEIKGGAETAAHLLKFDSVHGRWTPEVEARDERVWIDNQSLSFSEYATPRDVPWEEVGVDLVLECSGKFRTAQSIDPYFKRGVQKVIVAAPVKEGVLNIVMGVNDDLYQPDRYCQLNCSTAYLLIK